MRYSQPLTHCRRSCGNNFHIKCLRIWGEHKVQTRTHITCPMCRCQWPSLLSDLARDQTAF
jgi:E3 ubiquitin-protein ligase ZSWIM2